MVHVTNSESAASIIDMADILKEESQTQKDALGSSKETYERDIRDYVHKREWTG